VNCSSARYPLVLTVAKYPCLKRQWVFRFTYMLYFLNHCQQFTGLDYIWVQWRVSNKKQKYLIQRQANDNNNTENWKMSMDIIEKTGLTQVLANVGHAWFFTSTFLDKCCLIFVLKHSINYEINKIKNARILYVWEFY
jgi:hypothetical protein